MTGNALLKKSVESLSSSQSGIWDPGPELFSENIRGEWFHLKASKLELNPGFRLAAGMTGNALLKKASNA
jgi:hypothetical protein